jgi:hypothetical protein
MNPIEELLFLQDGVISRRQALAAGMSAVQVARLLRRREWVAIHPGVYVSHTGEPTWRQRAWAAVLACWPAALDGPSALRAHEGPGRRHFDGSTIAVMVAQGRRIRPPEGVVVRRARRFDDQVQWNLAPPRMRYDDAVIDLADRARSDLTAIAVLADACGGRRTTAGRLLATVDATPRLRRRAWLRSVLDDVASGTCSVLEHGYLTRVERPHGLPRGRRQAPATSRGRRMWRDVLYSGGRPSWTQIVELDGRLSHDSATARDRDMERDLDAAVDGAETVRLGYGQIYDRPCRTAAKVARLLRRRGWRGHPRRCPECADEGGPGYVA